MAAIPAADQAASVDSARSWVVAVASSFVIAVGFGTVYTFGAFFEAMAEEFDSGLGSTSIVFGITAFLFFGTGAVSGFLADRVGARPLVWIGGALFAGGLFATSRVDALWQGYLTYGIGVGLGGGLFNAPVFAMVTGWFDRYRGIAQGIVATGSGAGTLVLLPLAEGIIDRSGWRDAYLVLAVIAGVTFAVSGLFVHRPPVEPPPLAIDHLREVVRTPAFRRAAACAMLQSGSMLSAFAFVVPFATDRGVSASTAALLVGLIGASSIVGRLLLTGIADRIGPIRMLQVSFLVQPLAFLIWLFSGSAVAALVVFALVLGVAYGGFVALIPVMASHLFGVRGIGSVLGALFLAGGAGGLIVPPVLRFITDAVDGQTVPILVITGLSATGAILLLGLQRDPADLSLSRPPSLAAP